jgi:metabotropic X receptor
VLNRDPKMIPNVTIGAHIMDDCDYDTYGLEMAVYFIKGREIDCNFVILL